MKENIKITDYAQKITEVIMPHFQSMLCSAFGAAESPFKTS